MGKPSLEERFAINDLFVRYTTSLDRFDTEAIIGCFSDICTLSTPIHGEFIGHDGIREWMKPNLKIRDIGGQFRHVISNMIIDIDGSRARVTCYLLDFLTLPGQPAVLLSPGVYECDLIKTADEWLFETRVVHMDYKFVLPI